MKRATKSRHTCTDLHIDSKGLGWDGLIIAAESELERIEHRSAQLKAALGTFRKRKQAGDPFIGSEKSQPAATQN